LGLGEGLKVYSGTGSPGWEALVQKIHGAPTAFDAGLRRSERPPLGVTALRKGRNVLVVEDTDNYIYETGLAGVESDLVLQQIADYVYSELPDEFDFITILIDWTVNVPFAYYLPLSNETRGIGLANVPPYMDTFDQTEGKLQGFIFMNNWRFYMGDTQNLSRIVWLQEIGHRWGSFVGFDKGDGEGTRLDLLGRDQAHWSYFMHTQNSALEGNDWQDNGDGSFTTLSNSSRMTYGSLDLYLMGVLPSEEVEPFFFIDDPDARNLRDSNGGRINPASPPEPLGELKTILGTRVDVGVEDVVRAEGARNPSYRESQKKWRMATVFVKRPGAEVDDAQLTAIEDLLDFWEGLFEEATRGQMDLVVNLDGEELAEGLALGQGCVESAQCDGVTSTTCAALSDGTRVCTKRCAAASECGGGYCCADPTGEGGASFCLPAVDAACEAVEPEPEEDVGPPDQDAGDEQDAGGDGDTGGQDVGGQDAGGEQDGSVEVGSAARGDDGCGCSVSPRGPSVSWAVGLLGALAGWLGGRRRRS
jgi:MYXO-CTERM domain-containing protein